MAKPSRSLKKFESKTQPKPRTKVTVSQAPGFSVWQLTLLGVLLFTAAYIFASLAIDSGSYWHYLFCFVTTYLAIKFTSQAIRTYIKEKR